jgi:cathepsin L
MVHCSRADCDFSATGPGGELAEGTEICPGCGSDVAGGALRTRKLNTRSRIFRRLIFLSSLCSFAHRSFDFPFSHPIFFSHFHQSLKGSIMLRIATFLLVATACCLAAPTWQALHDYTFDQYIRDFDKGYLSGTAEYTKREKLFRAALDSILDFNRNPLNRYRQGVNHLTDTTSEERKSFLFGRKELGRTQKYQSQRFYEMTNASLPASIDYRFTQPAVVTAVKNQGRCGSCWTFASSAEVESHHAIATGKLFVLSPQQLTSCVENPQHCGGSGGCEGATTDLAFDYLVNVSGMTQEWTYPYTSFYGDSGVCSFNRTMMGAPVNLTAYYSLPTNSEAALAEALVLRGPIAVSVDATNWHLYEAGIYDGCNYADNITINHAVQLVGYGTEGNTPYWIIRNSWSAGFGENGYIRLLRDSNCGWNTPTADGVACAGDPVAAWTCGQCGLYYDNTFPLVGASPGPRPVFLLQAGEAQQGTTYTKTEFTAVSAVAGVLAVVSMVSVIALLRKPSGPYSGVDVPLNPSKV